MMSGEEVKASAAGADAVSVAGVKESSVAGVKASELLGEEVVSTSRASGPGCWNAARSVVDAGRMATATVLLLVPTPPSDDRSNVTVPATTSAVPAIGVVQA